MSNPFFANYAWRNSGRKASEISIIRNGVSSVEETPWVLSGQMKILILIWAARVLTGCPKMQI